MRPSRLILGLLGILALSLVAACSSYQASPATEDAGTDLVRTPGSLSSYRYRVDLRTNADLIDTSSAPAWLDVRNFRLHIAIEGQRVNPDRERTTAVVDLGYFSLERESVAIGQRYWVRQETGPWKEELPLTEPQDFIGQDLALSPAIILEPVDPAVTANVARALAGEPFTIEQVNGFETRHWVLENDDLDRLFPSENDNPLPGISAPSKKRAEIWVDTETRVTVRAIVQASSPTTEDAFFLQIDLFDLNASSLQIEAPPVTFP